MNHWHLNPDHSDAEARLFASLERDGEPITASPLSAVVRVEVAGQRDHGRVADLSGQLAAPAMRAPGDRGNPRPPPPPPPRPAPAPPGPGPAAPAAGAAPAPAPHRFAHNAPQWRVPPDNDRCRTRHIACSHEDRE
ncbi:MAG: hypothetical protein IPN00_07500 [Hydrogenophilales bacterium]|nr:hypothetical protein [Hydrogenophilales bacterium]